MILLTKSNTPQLAGCTNESTNAQLSEIVYFFLFVWVLSVFVYVNIVRQ